MISKKQFADAAHKILRHSRGLQDPRLMHPEREWVIGLCVALAICVVAASGSAYTYWKNKHLTAEVPSTAEEAVVYRESMVKEALKQFAKRNAEREALMGNMVVPKVTLEGTIATTSVATSTASTTEPAAAEASTSEETS